MKPLRVAIVCETPDAWESARRVRAVAAALPPNEFVVEFVSPRQGSFAEWRRLTNMKADVIHLADEWAVAYVGSLLAARRRVPFVCTVADYRREATWLRRRLEKFVYRRAAAVVANDPHVAERRRAECGLNTAPPWEVLEDRSLLPVPPTSDRATLCAELDVPLNARLIGTFGPLTASQNMRDVIWLEALLRLLYEDTYIVIVGAGPSLLALQQFATAMHVEDRVRFMTEPAAFNRLVSQLTLYVDAARWSGPSTALYLAQAAGIPVLAVDTPMRRRELAVDRSGYLFAEHDRAVLTRRCYKLLEDEGLRQALGSAGRDFAASIQQAASANAATWADMYRRAAAQS